MIINWGLEAYKWKLLIRRSEEISFGTSCQAILGGLAAGVFTPNRIGEFIGRVFILKNTKVLKGVVLTLIGSFSQLLVTIVFGAAAFAFISSLYLINYLPDMSWLWIGLSVGMLLTAVAAIYLYFNITVLNRFESLISEKLKYKVAKGFEALSDFPKLLLFKTLLISALRYFVFSFQLYIALLLCNFQVTPALALIIIPLIFLFLAAIPTIALSEIGVRGSIAVFLFGLVSSGRKLPGNEALAVISATTLLWLINIALPSLLGLVAIFRLKFFRP